MNSLVNSMVDEFTELDWHKATTAGCLVWIEFVTLALFSEISMVIATPTLNTVRVGVC